MSKKYVELFASASINPKVTLGELIQNAKNEEKNKSNKETEVSKSEKK